MLSLQESGERHCKKDATSPGKTDCILFLQYVKSVFIQRRNSQLPDLSDLNR